MSQQASEPSAERTQVPLRIRSDEGKSVRTTTELVGIPSSQRTTKAAILAVGGIGLGAVLIVIPIVHLITTWLFPLLGVLGAWKVLNTPARFTSIEAPCPSCQEGLHWVAGGATFPLRESCPHCNRILEILVVED